MAIAVLGSLGNGYNHPLWSAGSQNPQVTVPAGGIPAGSTLILFIYSYFVGLSSVTDSRGNAYVVRHNDASGILHADCQVTMPLLAGDKITVNGMSSDPNWSITGGWFSPCSYHGRAPASGHASFDGSAAATGGAFTTSVAGELLLGVFGGYGGGASGQTPAAAIASAGAGYTNQPGAAYASNYQTDSAGIFCDWESKIGGSAGSETATATLNTAVYAYATAGVTIAYKEPLVNQMMGVV